MPVEQSLVGLIRKLFGFLEPKRRRQFSVLVILMMMASLAEVVSIASIIPLLGVMTAPERVFEYASARPFIEALELSAPQELLLPITITFCIAAIVAGGIRLFLLYGTTRYSFAVGADLCRDVYRKTLFQPYSVHISRSSSKVINGILGKTAMTTGSVLMPLLTLISSVILLVAILCMLLSVEPWIILIASTFFASIYGFISFVSRKRLRRDSKRISLHSNEVLKCLQEGLGAIRDVLLDGTQDLYCRVFQKADRVVRRSQGNIIFVSGSPRFFVETSGLVLIAIFAYSLANREEGLDESIPLLGMLVLGAQRLLPVLQQAYNSVTIIAGAREPLRDVLELLEQPLPDPEDEFSIEPVEFSDNLRLQNVGFRYSDDTAWIVRGVTLEIPKGQRLGVVGQTGSGKSTLLDIMMGLLSPTEGAIEIDGRKIGGSDLSGWQRNIAHVPQSIFLIDSSISENIALGVPKHLIDMDRVKDAAERAQIADVIKSLKDSYDTFVGERGVKLSGGQRQRIGIARALYKRAEVIIFDEATSALDHETERAVMRSIETLNPELTIIIVAHRLSTLEGCDRVVKVSHCKIAEVDLSTENKIQTTERQES